MPKASQSYFEIRSSPIQGRGAFATRRIRKGTRLIEYVGERISHAEADRRYDDDTMRRHHTFLFTLNNRTVIDAAVDGNEARFINHSCSPNCEAVIDSGHIYIESTKTIQPGAELVYDYQYERAPDADESDEARYPCRCGSPNCRGTILAPPKRKRAAASAKRGKGASKRGKAGAKKKSSSKKKGTTSKRKSTAAKRTKRASQRSAPATRGGTLTRKLGKTSSTRAKKSAPGAKKTPGRKASPNRLKAAAKRRRSA
ncbi:MAG TPA: SET domain-containing protein-lysine N-methyltransferase [Gemmatimonadaceae bacterium]|nr:SET domain-containing protein-lysine N-methyltransferase [Gemmatimonadaceae bacterium]